MGNTSEIINIEIQLFLEAIFQKYGHDFRAYSSAHTRRRLLHRMKSEGYESLSQMQHQLLYTEDLIQPILSDFSINVTEMFRDPGFYKALRSEVFPLLKTYPFIKIWHAGCSTGEEVYSMAILLEEEGLYDRSVIYATDFNQAAISKAREGIYPISRVKNYAHGYILSGGLNTFSDFYEAGYDSIILKKSLRRNMVFSDHNLVTDNVFAEVNLILCRNVLIYFTRSLQERVVKLFFDSLPRNGILCLGNRENLQFSKLSSHFNIENKDEKIYRKISEIA
ncbi:MAG: protein-glutamate O-methyltransferase CheR [Bacteroidales bacterium]|jgi:chemotaxis protein methyltransferase CheR|nr:protein-glutamate O-methyltransferase CheR [Bacteroidales bacterium]